MGEHWHPLIGTCHSKWFETASVNWYRVDLYLCLRGLKFIVSCNQEQCPILMLIFVKFWWLRAKIQGGGLTPKGIVGNQTHFVFESYWVGPLIWLSFIQIGEIACVTPAWSSHGHSHKSFYRFGIHSCLATSHQQILKTGHSTWRHRALWLSR